MSDVRVGRGMGATAGFSAGFGVSATGAVASAGAGNTGGLWEGDDCSHAAKKSDRTSWLHLDMPGDHAPRSMTV